MRLTARSAVLFCLLAPVLLLSAVVLLTSACTPAPTATLAGAASTDRLPTWIAETVAAGASATARLVDQLSPTSGTPPAAASATPTPPPTSTLSAMGPSPTASITPTPTSTPLPVQATRTPPPQPTASIPAAAIQIRRPGPLSRLVSPLQVQASARPGPDGRVRIELFGEDGRLMVRKISNYGAESGWVFISEELEFETSLAAEAARLVISGYDNFNRLAWLQSVDLVLLSLGQDDINPSAAEYEPVVAQEPLPNKLIQGGTLLLNGLTNLPDEQLLLVELVTATGKIVGYRQAAVQPDPEEGFAPFSAEVPYTVEEPTWVRLTVKQNSLGRLPGVVYATSFEVLLSP